MSDFGMSKEELKKLIIDNLKNIYRKTIENATPEEIYKVAAYSIRDVINDKWMKTHEQYKNDNVKIVYYLSMEFLVGRFMGNAVMNLTMYDVVKDVFDDLGINYNMIEDIEPDPGLGNGGLGRLAACFLDSLSTMELPAYGCGIRYHYGIFEQKIENNEQTEYPDNWLDIGDPWGIRRYEYEVSIKFGGTVKAVLKPNGDYKYEQENCQIVTAVPYDYPVVGYDNNTVNTLRLWDVKTETEFNLKSFNEGDFKKAVEEQNMIKNISEVLYPADDNTAGKELRLRQQYFFISATIQRAIDRFKKDNKDLHDLPEKVAFQLNDTHPAMAVPELMRILVDENDMEWSEAFEITRKVCAYTNHTIMSEALEKWPLELFSRLLPRIYQIIEEINRRFCLNLIDMYGNDNDKIRNMAIIADGQIRMAYLAIVGSHSVNGVAALHTEILKKQELKGYYEIYPKKFNNKTNGITQRRWLLHANKQLADLVTEKIGKEWVKDLSQLNQIEKYASDPEFVKKFIDIKKANKVLLADFIKRTQGVEINPDSIFDIQIKRLHEYKRQLLNVLHIIYLYNKLKANPDLDIAPRTFIFGAKAAASYTRAKKIIKLINCMGEVINNDESIKGKLKVVFVENYRVSLAEKLIPAADISEQISTAGKEASGTGNMKFMLNGALTLGTMDGANVEIFEEVGEENIFIFGLSSDEAIKKYEENNYDPWMIYNINQDVRMALNCLINGTFDEDPEAFREIYDSLLNTNYGRADVYFVLEDFESYKLAQEKVDKAFKDKEAWAKATIINVARSGKFSSDRTIKEYADDIWNLKPVHINM